MSRYSRPNPLWRPFDILLLHVAAALILLKHWRATWPFWFNHRRLPRIAVPQTFNDKVFWRKVVDRNPIFVTFNDKVRVRDWIAANLPELKLTRMIWHGKNPQDMPDKALTGPAMIKANHGCGYNLPYDGQTPCRAEIVTKLEGWLGGVFGESLSEWAYGEIPPQALIEEMLSFECGASPYNYNVHSADGKVLWVGIFFSDETGQRKLGYFSETGDRLPVKMTDTMAAMDESFCPGDLLIEAVNSAKVLSKGVDYVRCDFLVTDSTLWFNEMTTYSGSGHNKFSDPEYIDCLQKPWDLRKSWFLSTRQSGLREIYRKALLRELSRRA